MNTQLVVKHIGALATDPSPGPIEQTDWRNTALTGGALVIVVTGFFLALKHAGRAAR